jgi:polyisoprenoid-binding protein YceI
MMKFKFIALALITGTTIMVSCGFSEKPKTQNECTKEASKPVQTMNLFVTHGHCSTPFTGQIENLELITTVRTDQGNPLENMKLNFEINPNTFVTCFQKDLTERIKRPGLFINEKNENIKFRSTNVYTMGLDWYQINGVMSIKGVENEVKLFATGIRRPKESLATTLVIEGQLDLLDWGIDYDKIVNGESNTVPTKWMHFNMQIDVKDYLAEEGLKDLLKSPLSSEH